MKKEDFFEVLGGLGDEIVKEAGEPVKRSGQSVKKSGRSLRFGLGAAAACLCLVAAGAFVLLRPRKEPEGTQTGKEDEITQPAGTDMLVINEADSISSMDMDVQFTFYNDLSPDEWETAAKAFESALGIGYEDFTGRIPDKFSICSFYSADARDKTSETGYAPHDYVFECRTDQGGEVRIAVCAFEKPLRDCIIKSGDPDPSSINGVTVVAYGYGNSSFMAEFFHENVYYDIEAGNITLEEFEELLKSIMG